MCENILKNNVPCEKLQDTSAKNSSRMSSTASTLNVCLSTESYGCKSISVDEERKQRIIDSDWGGYALDLDLWEDSKSPVIQVRSNEISFDNKECCGFLSDRLIGTGLSFLTRSPESGLYVLSKCVLKNKNLTDVTMLQYHHHLQYVNIAYNNISCLSFLDGLPYLMYLNASHNNIEYLPNFALPWYLTYVNLSYNHMTNIGDLKNCWSIVRLNLSHNIIENISDFENLKHLQYLNLSYNLIQCITNLDGLNIRELNLEGNCITSFKSATPGNGINTLPHLQVIILGYNRLSTLEFFKDAYNLRYVDLKFNKITDLLEVLNLKGMINKIDLTGNACTKWPNYRNMLISSIPSVRFVDGVEVFTTEKVTSAMLFASPLDLTAARKVAKLMLLEQLNISKMDDHIQPYDEIYPPLVILTGPAALKKMALILHIAQTIPEKIKYCRWHTTKEMCEDDDELNAHILINREEFNDLARRGEFLVILDRLGESYGFHTNQISPLISENKIGLTQMNLYAVTEMSKRYPNAQPILVLTQSVDLHRDWIREKFNVHTWIKDSVEDLLVVKRSKHPEDMEVETASCILHFVEEILDEIMHRLEFPSYSISIKPQNGATSTNVILTSKKMLPKVVIQRSELILREKECIKPKKTKINGDLVKFDRLLAEEKQARKELKVLLDEDSNIIIDDKETKREMLRSRMLRRRHSLIKNRLNDFDNSELSESVSSEEETEIRQEKIMHKKARALKNTYVELVLKTRQMYLDYHESHPGFFTSVLVMDDYAEAFNSLSDLINELYTSQSYRKPIFLSEIEHFRQTKISIALENIVNEIRGNLSTSKLQHSTILKM
ncbi:leucine-rich repeat and guanylate kinase domain-containing protein-like isoform X2 [Nylanderia fulva]|uniref:leucine-rich repeat and guanylate kinase domain-containing protein-like isoform X2 n=1 Tax=Nylanderia fulva TaxID=613905 RepID=UPI0010FAFB5E|nr:leucine-rich repeat and guanylate kinase domain-containing protein-like isoform X2 [Nylanderia fulva]